MSVLAGSPDFVPVAALTRSSHSETLNWLKIPVRRGAAHESIHSEADDCNYAFVVSFEPVIVHTS
jgi:hypothetical protein